MRTALEGSLHITPVVLIYNGYKEKPEGTPERGTPNLLSSQMFTIHNITKKTTFGPLSWFLHCKVDDAFRNSLRHLVIHLVILLLHRFCIASVSLLKSSPLSSVPWLQAKRQ